MQQIQNEDDAAQKEGDELMRKTRTFTPREPQIEVLERVDTSATKEYNTSFDERQQKLNQADSNQLLAKINTTHDMPASPAKMPQKYLNEMKNLHKASDSYKLLINELLERQSASEKILSKINDYYDNNLRGLSVKQVLDHQRDTDIALTGKASVLELKKLFSNIRKSTSLTSFR